jgi:hypothetical protein
MDVTDSIAAADSSAAAEWCKGAGTAANLLWISSNTTTAKLFQNSKSEGLRVTNGATSAVQSEKRGSNPGSHNHILKIA